MNKSSKAGSTKDDGGKMDEKRWENQVQSWYLLVHAVWINTGFLVLCISFNTQLYDKKGTAIISV
jgi:hypothetical protein